MNWQYPVVVVVVVAAAAYLLRQTWRSWHGRKAGCGGNCECSGERPNVITIIPVDQLKVRGK
jgi:hypothetical protein